MMLYSRTPFPGAVSEYLPSSPVTVLLSVPRTCTVTPFSGAPVVVVTVPETWRSWATAVPHNTVANNAPSNVCFMASSSWGSAHGREAVLGDQLAIRGEHDVPGLHGLGEPVRRERVQLSLAVGAHVGQRLAGVHVLQRAQLGVVESHVGDDDVYARLQAIDHDHQTVHLGGRRRPVLRIVDGFPEIARHAEPILPREPLDELAELRLADRGAHVVVDVIDLETRAQRPGDLGPQLLLPLLHVRVVPGQ